MVDTTIWYLMPFFIGEGVLFIIIILGLRDPQTATKLPPTKMGGIFFFFITDK